MISGLQFGFTSTTHVGEFPICMCRPTYHWQNQSLACHFAVLPPGDCLHTNLMHIRECLHIGWMVCYRLYECNMRRRFIKCNFWFIRVCQYTRAWPNWGNSNPFQSCRSSPRGDMVQVEYPFEHGKHSTANACQHQNQFKIQRQIEFRPTRSARHRRLWQNRAKLINSQLLFSAPLFDLEHTQLRSFIVLRLSV